MTAGSDFPFAGQGEESIQARIKRLIGKRSMRQAAIAWGLSYSTLNNYFEKGTTPGLKVVKNICEAEKVSLEWLVWGDDRQPRQRDVQGDNGPQALLTIWEGLEPTEKEQLSRLLIRKGADFLTLLLDREMQELHNFTGVRRAAALSLKNWPEERIREVFAGSETAADHFNITDKQAGA